MFSTSLAESPWRAIPSDPFVSYSDAAWFGVGWTQNGAVSKIFPYSLAFGAARALFVPAHAGGLVFFFHI